MKRIDSTFTNKEFAFEANANAATCKFDNTEEKKI